MGGVEEKILCAHLRVLKKSRTFATDFVKSYRRRPKIVYLINKNTNFLSKTNKNHGKNQKNGL